MLAYSAGNVYSAPKLIKAAVPARPAVAAYNSFEITIELSRTFPHPYDPAEIMIDADITAPDRTTVTVPAYFTGTGKVWKVRFTPSSIGAYSYIIRAQAGQTKEMTAPAPFTVTGGTGNGFIRKNRNNPYYPVFDSGRSFFGIGHNIAWVSNNSPEVFERYFDSLSKNGGNLARIWINSPWGLPIEQDKLGNYNTKNLDSLDEIIAKAEKYGIYLIIAMDSYGSLMTEKGAWGEGSWSESPYNAANGGPCKDPFDFFTDITAKKYYKNRLRHIIARTSHSPNIFAFELWNETNTPPVWMKEMAAYIKAVNPHKQLVTSSLGYPWGMNFNKASINELQDIDIISQHMYGNRTPDIIDYLSSVCKALAIKYKKPLTVSEFGIDIGKDDRLQDPSGDGCALHTGLWASAFSGCCTGALNWWWDSYIKPKNLYSHYKAFAEFIKDVDWNSTDFMFLQLSPVTVTSNSGQPYTNVKIHTTEEWGETAYSVFNVRNNGDVDGGILNYYLQGMQNDAIRVMPTFYVDYPADGKFLIEVGTVSQGAHLTAILDNKPILDLDFPAGPDKGPWKRSMYRKDHKVYQCVYNTVISLDVPKGKHTIKLQNTGVDWLGIKNITLTNYSGGPFAHARCMGLKAGKTMLIWIQNKEYTWYNMRNKREPGPIAGASFSIMNVDDGNYAIEWWDTFKGSVFLRASARADAHVLKVSVPDFNKDMACKIIKQ